MERRFRIFGVGDEPGCDAGRVLVLKIVNSEPEKELRRPTVLVVEDDPLIRSSLAEHLRALGYSIVEAANAAEGIAIFAAGVPIDVVFSDIRMPGTMDGLGLARWIRRHHPAVRVALTSGTGGGARATQVSEIFVRKPYQVAEVAAHIARLLAEATTPPASSDPSNMPVTEPLPPRQAVRRRRSTTRRPRRTTETREPKPDQPPGLSDGDKGPPRR